jgi:membrane protease YdiL (CAAX protease family)
LIAIKNKYWNIGHFINVEKAYLGVKKLNILSIILCLLPIGVQYIERKCLPIASAPKSILFFVVAIVIAPISEELGFRLVLPRIICHQNENIIDIVIFSIAFAFLHVFNTGSILTALSAFCFSLYMYFLRIKTKSIYYPIMAHVVWNLAAIIL